ncbi:hypothetical protein ONZ43_g1516 [Nemania bipapillata]|uniref:Uncharacterized protein n=1 Tax=Nemania bipapillata TaxID=110536 RepID=A0ACC2J433_9PEZI|nr:hypothetical protein ONZ43_g1516 [Nemania bipapillata]
MNTSPPGMGEAKSTVVLEAEPEKFEERVAPDQFDEGYRTTKKEIYAYYCYYIGNNGLTPFNFASPAFQNLLYQAAGDKGVLPFAGKNRSINSIMLLCSGISFAIQIVLFLTIGSFADFGYWRPNILIVQSLIAYAVGFGWLGAHSGDKWQVAAGLYIVGLISYQMTFTFWNAAFPGLARNTLEMKAKADAYVAGDITRDEYDYADSLMRSRLANVAFFIQSVAEIVILAIIIGIMFGLKIRENDANNSWGLSVTIAFGSAVWVLVSIPWFFLEKRRPGQDPGKRSIIAAGLWQICHAMKTTWRLKQSLIYLIGYVLLADSVGTTVTVISTLQNTIVAYDGLELTYLLIVLIAAQGFGIFTFWWCHKRFRLGSKTMFSTIAVAIVILDGWGMIGIWTDKFGFHNLWEFWVYQVYNGFLICPGYSYSQIMISEVTPRGHEFLFFSLFSIVGMTSSFIGPLVSSAIIDATPSHNNSTPFYFLFGLSAPEEPVRCILTEVNLTPQNKSLSYQALSYVWGSPADTIPIIVNGQEFHATSNLNDALRQLRQAGGQFLEKDIWVDAICINQHDLDEKSKQVPRMADIYSMADRVVIWLGCNSAEEEELFRRGFECRSKLHEIYLRDVAGTGTGFDDWSYEQVYPELDEAETETLGIWHLMSRRPWFTRIWTVQEFCLAGDSSIFYAGAHSMTVGALMLWGGAGLASFTSSRDKTEMRTMFGRRMWFQDQLSLNTISSRETCNVVSTLLELIMRTGCVAASVPHDRIYGLLALATQVPSIHRDLPEELQPNYLLSYETSK